MSSRPTRPRSSSSQQEKLPELSCEGCNERKVRCDKGHPCSACQATGLVCVPIQRKRLPRGRHVKENKELRERLARLENALANGNGAGDTSSSASISTSSTPSLSASTPASTPFSSATSINSSSGTPAGYGSRSSSVSVPGVGQAFCPGAMSYPLRGPSASASDQGVTPPFGVSSALPAPLPRPSRSLGTPPPRFLANAFWNDLVDKGIMARLLMQTQKNPKLHAVLSDQSVDHDDIDDGQSESGRSHQSQSYDTAGMGGLAPPQRAHVTQHRGPDGMLGFGFSRHTQNPQSTIDAALAMRPTPIVCKRLCQAYLHRVDPIVRIFHRPSLMAFLLNGEAYLHYHEADPVLDAIRSAVFFVAVVSLTEEQCRTLFHLDRTHLINTYRLACEVALDRTGLITTEDVTVLQSFVLYLIAVRSHDRSRTVWTLFPIAVRLATALGLNVDTSHGSETFFEQQMRRRLWHTICVLDLHSSFDRGSEPVIGQTSVQPRLPFNINDADYGPDADHGLSDREGLTDMTKALVQYHAQAVGRALGAQSDDAPTSSQASAPAMSPRQRVVQQFEHHTQKLLRYCDPQSSPYAWLTFNGSLAALASIQLSLRRPMSHSGHRVSSTETEPNHILRLATTVLERDITMRSDARGEPFRWYGMVHWHPLAVAIAECYVCDNVTILQHVWPTIESSFETIGRILTEYRQGSLWKPLERLMLKARSRVQTLLDQSSNGDSPAYATAAPMVGDPFTAYGSAPVPLAAPSTSMSFTLPNTPAPYHMNLAPSAHSRTPSVSTQHSQGAWTPDGQADPSSSSWQGSATSPASMSDAGWNAWDDFIKNFDANWSDDMVVV